MTTETFTNTVIGLNDQLDAARQKFDSVPLVKHRARLASNTERLAPMESVAIDRYQTITSSVASAEKTQIKYDFLAAIHEEIIAAEPQWKKDLREQEAEAERRAEEKEANAQLMAMTAEDEE